MNRPRANCGVLRLAEASSLRPDSPRTLPQNETVKLPRRQMTLANSPVQWPTWTWCLTWWNHSRHSNLKKISVTLPSSVGAFLWCIDIMLFRELRATAPPPPPPPLPPPFKRVFPWESYYCLNIKSPRKLTLWTPLTIDQWYILGIFEHKWGTWKHIDNLKNTHGAL